MLDDLLSRFRKRDRLALARLLTLLARGEHVEEVVAKLGPPAHPARVTALTGSGGVGKSTLAGKLIEVIRRSGQTVAVLACDPQSPISGGALLGDRFRMDAAVDEGVFIRSLAAPGGQGAVASYLAALIQIIEVFGFENVLIETVGAGQGDTVVRDLVDVLVLLLQPETGDDLQWEKAGVLEVADVIFVQKADLPGAEQVEAQVRAALALAGETTVPVLRGSARTGAGVEALWNAIAGRPLRRQQATNNSRELLHTAQELLASRLATAEAMGNREVQHLLARWRSGQLTRGDAGAALLHLLGVADLRD